MTLVKQLISYFTRNPYFLSHGSSHIRNPSISPRIKRCTFFLNLWAVLFFMVLIFSSVKFPSGIFSYTCYSQVKQVPHTHQQSSKWVIIKNSTCYSEGKKVKKCIICKKIIKSSEIPTKNHSYRNHRCIYCGEISYTEKEGKTVFIDSFICKENGISLSGNVVIPEYVYYEGNTCKVTGVNQMAFQNNDQISSIVLPKSVKYIGDFAFDTCQNLSSVELPEGLEYIGYAAFQCCYKLDKIVFPKSLRYVQNFSYNHLCSANNSSIWIPASIELFGENDIHYPAHMFYDCGTEVFTSFKVSKNNPSYKSKNGILYTKDGKTLVSIPRGKNFKNQTYIMPNSISNLGELSFSRNQNIKNVVISDNLIVDGIMNDIENALYIKS